MNESHFNGPLAVLIRRITELAPENPWPEEVELAVNQPDAIPLCVDCLYPQVERRWFCPHCDYPVGEYVIMMPYLYIFPLGEVLRRGVTGPPEKGLARLTGHAFFALIQYAPLAPVYWFWMAQKARGHPICQVRRRELSFEDPSPAPGPAENLS